MTTPDFAIRNRAELVDALSVAARVEHVVLLEYLYAAFSCRHTQDPTVAAPVQLTSWELARDLYDICHQEMDHLGTVQQLLAALGAPPVPDAWTFPVNDPRVPFDARLTRLDVAALQRFVDTEAPPPVPGSPLEALPTPPDPIRFDVLGDLYRAIIAGLDTLGDAVFLGTPLIRPPAADGQEEPEEPLPEFAFGAPLPVATAAEAIASLRKVVEEGEGSGGAPGGHWERFTQMRNKLSALGAEAGLASWPCVTNPVLQATGLPGATVLTDPVTVAVADIANRAYRALWLLLGGAYVLDWSASDDEATRERRKDQRMRSWIGARLTMATVVRPLGEILARLPAFAGQADSSTAGMCFEQYGEFRVPAQPDARLAATLAELAQIATDLDAVAGEPALAAPWAGPRLAALAGDVRLIGDRLRGTVGGPPRDLLEPAGPGPWLSVDFEGWYQVRLATGGDPYNDPRGVSGWQFAFPGEPDLDRVLRLQPEGTFRRPQTHEDISIGVRVTSASASVDGDSDSDGDGALPALTGARVDLLDRPVFEGHNGVVAGDADEPIVPLRLRIAAGDVVLERSALDTYVAPYLELTSLGPEADVNAAAEALRAAHGLGADDLTDRVTADLGRLGTAVESAPDAVTRRVLEIRRDGYFRAFFFTVAWRLRLVGTDAVVRTSGTAPAPSTEEPWWLELLSTGFDQDAGCALLRGVLHAPLPRADGTVGTGPPPWRIAAVAADRDTVASMPLDVTGFRPGRLGP